MEQELITVEEVANRLQVQPSWVYSHSTDLGAFRLGKYLRFSWSRVLEHLDGASLGSQPNDRFQVIEKKEPAKGREQNGNSSGSGPEMFPPGR